MKRKHFRAAQSLTTRQEGLHIFNPLHIVNFSSDFPCLMIIFLKLSESNSEILYIIILK